MAEWFGVQGLHTRLWGPENRTVKFSLRFRVFNSSERTTVMIATFHCCRYFDAVVTAFMLVSRCKMHAIISNNTEH